MAPDPDRQWWWPISGVLARERVPRQRFGAGSVTVGLELELRSPIQALQPLALYILINFWEVPVRHLKSYLYHAVPIICCVSWSFHANACCSEAFFLWSPHLPPITFLRGETHKWDDVIPTHSRWRLRAELNEAWLFCECSCDNVSNAL